MGDIAASTPAMRDKAANDKIVQIGDQLVRQGGAMPASPSAQFKLATAYFAGAGVARDPAAGAAMVQRAPRHRACRMAQHALGICS